jgi:hypothetical protein
VPLAAIELRAQPRWIAFSRDGRFAYLSTGDVIGAATRKIIGALEGPSGAKINSENFLELNLVDGHTPR